MSKTNRKRSAQPARPNIDSPKHAGAVQLVKLQHDLMMAKGIVSGAIDTLSAEEGGDQHPTFALRAADEILSRIADQMDPAMFWRTAEATIREAKALVSGGHAHG
ncbi:MAG TPA: hypothetical protein PKE27_00110 [Povalibacter sp.]|uniref:hypothetical protein n=1 Tax=Povalibacter sp. TaxID=1962978 RepID=UPI002B91AFB4|nr:hypothetical protein [Povalibacter sp.]HMN42949.1 hypothetical protein [Povalibacter sp.]